MIDLRFILHGNIPEAGAVVPALVEGTEVRSRDIESLFPFEGEWCFRVREAGVKFGCSDDFVWLDLEDGMVFAFEEGNKRLDVRAMPIALPVVDGAVDGNAVMLDEYLTLLEHKGLVQRGPRHKLDPKADRFWLSSGKKGKSMLQKVSKGLDKRLNKAARGVGVLWGKVSSAASQGLQAAVNMVTEGPPSVLSDYAEENLSRIGDHLESPFDESNPIHMRILQDLWQALNAAGLHEPPAPSAPFQRVGTAWKGAGFQNEDPIKDLKSTGVLALQAFAFMCRRYPTRTARMMTVNRQNVSSNYPLAIVVVSTTDLVAGLLHLRGMAYLSQRTTYWEMFESPDAFNEVFVLAVAHVDALWTFRKAKRSDFVAILAETKELLTQVLGRGPRSLQMLRVLAEDEGMALPVLET